MGTPGVGVKAPEFSAPGTGDRCYSLDEYRGGPVVLVFYPGDATPVCTEQLVAYSTDFGQFEQLGATVLALSPQDVASHEDFSRMHGGFSFPLLYDEGKRIGEVYGILGPLGFYRRSVFIVDGGGIIRYARRFMAGLTYVKSPELIEVLAQVQGAPSR